MLDERAVSPRLQWTAVGAILVVALIARLLLLEGPALDRTSWKEIDFMAVSTNFWQHGFNLPRPEVSWPAEEPRFTAMEFPLVPYLAAILYELFGFGVHTVRLIPALSSLLLVTYLFLLVRRELGPMAGVLAAALSVPMALNHPFGRTLHSEPMLMALCVAAVFHFAQWIERRERGHAVAAGIALSLALAVKLEAILYLPPVLLWLAARRHGADLRRLLPAAQLAMASALLPAAWYAWAYHLELTGVHHFSVFLGHDKLQTLTMVSNPDWWTAMAGRVYEDVLGGVAGTVLALLGLAAAARLRRGAVFLVYLVAVGAFFGIVAEGNLDAPYRQQAAIPPLAAFAAIGCVAAGAAVGAVSRWRARTVAALTSVALVIGFPLQRQGEVIEQATDLRTAAEPGRWRLARELRRHLRPGETIVAVGEFDRKVGGNDLSPLVYHYAGVTGWTLEPGQFDPRRVERLAQRGADYVVVQPNFGPPSVPPAFVAEMRSRYRVMYERGPDLILDLRAPRGQRAPPPPSR